MVLRSIALIVAAVMAAIVLVDLRLQPPVSSAPPTTAQSAGAVTISVDPHASQLWSGFGASGAWWSGPVYHFTGLARHRLGNLLFSKQGLNLSQFRYNIGGGGHGVVVPWKADPSFYTANGTFNWNADPAGIYFLKMAKQYRVKYLIGFVNSAPAQFTSNHLSCGGDLPPAMVKPYAVYLAELVGGIRSHFGVKLNYISPMNEPANSFPSCKQEGMAVSINLRGQLVVDLGEALARYAPWCKVIADESSKIGSQLIPGLPKWADNAKVLKYLAVVAHHGYDFPPPSVLERMRSLVASLHKPSWTSEICCYDGARFGYQYDPTIVSGLWLADTIYDDIVYGGDSGFQWWTAVSPDTGCDTKTNPNCWKQVNYLGRNDGLVYYDLLGASNGDQSFFLTKRYFVMGNFSRYIRPGSKIHYAASDVAGIRALASIRGRTWSVVVINDQPTSAGSSTLQLQFPPGVKLEKALGAWATTSTESLRPVEAPQVSGDAAVGTVASSSVTTFVFKAA